ncbi:MAG: hypothetical protein ABI625_27780 [bacterium]
MKRQFFVTAGLLLFATTSAAAQGGQLVCPAGTTPVDPKTIAQDGCQQASDVFQFMAPQLGLALAGGNATLGTGTTLGGIGHFSIGIRANAFQGNLPDVGNFTQSATGARTSVLPTKDQWLGLPTADAAIGIFGGVPLGVTNVGGIDALVSASYVPTIDATDIKITPSSNVQVGYGVRVGLLSESIIVPGVSFTYLKRDLPTTSIAASSGNNTLTISNMKVNSSAWRVVASKSLLLFSFAAGGGKDKYDSSAEIAAKVNGSGTSIPGTAQKLERTNLFADVALNLPLFKIVGEVGQVSGGTVSTYNSFSTGRADKDQLYYSFGIRFGL